MPGSDRFGRGLKAPVGSQALEPLDFTPGDREGSKVQGVQGVQAVQAANDRARRGQLGSAADFSSQLPEQDEASCAQGEWR